MIKRVESTADNTVKLEDNGIVVTVLRGKQTGASVRAVSEEVLHLRDEARAKGKTFSALSDIRNISLSDISSDARLETKKQLASGSDRSAILGKRGVMSVIMYLQRISGNPNVRFFTSEREARAWLVHGNPRTVQRSAASIVAGVMLISIGLTTLIGWQADSRYLTSWLTSLAPMNPRAAIGLLAAGFGFCCYWFGKLKWLKLAGIFGVLLGVGALLPIHIGYVLYGQKVAAAGPHADIATSAALCFIALGLSPFTIAIKKGWLRRSLQYPIGALLLSLGLFNVFGQLYAHDFIYGLGGSFVMAFNLAIAFTVAGAALVLMVLYRKIGSSLLGQVNRMGWLLVTILLFTQIATYGAWEQVISRNQFSASQAFTTKVDDVQSSLALRTTAYLNALYGFKGLFAASDYVDQGEFDAYYQSLNLNQNYPGLRALSFISKVSTKDLPAFTAKHQADASLHAGGNPTFAITNMTALPDHYIVTYVADSSTVGGNDLSAQPSRMQAFVRAEASDKPVSSGTLQFAASAAAPAQSGFFLTIPVTAKSDPHKVIGFVNAVFGYNDFFARAFSEEALLKDLNLYVSDPADGSLVFTRGKQNIASSKAITENVSIPMADHHWRLLFSASPSFGTSNAQSYLPRIILVGGQLFSALLLVIFIVLLRARRQGYQLADTITLDLQRERNLAVANDQKNTAILNSIGDAVFAIDRNGRIQLFNPAAQRISGFSEAEALNKPYGEILKFEFEKTDKINRGFITAALSGKLATMANHTVLTRKDGTRIPVADSAAPIHDSKNNIIGAIVVFRDITKDYELDKAKTEFVSLASHQLRTPLSAINWYGEMLLNGDAGKTNKTQTKYLHEIFDGNQRMIELVNALLDVSRLEVGKLPNKPEPVNVGALINDLEKELLITIRTKHLKLTKHVAALPSVVADPKQLRMVIQNLMSNAVKYTPAKGEIQVTLRTATPADIHAAGFASGEPRWFLSVKDTGYGIPKAQQDKIFGKLFRADNVRTLDVEGTGLGLYIVKEVVEKLGGRVWFESTESVGTTFFVVVPMRAQKVK